MHPQLDELFTLLADYRVIIVGSALRDCDAAKDIDVMFLDGQEFVDACVAFRLTGNGWDTSRGHVSVANLSPRYIGKKVQFIHMDTTVTPEDHPHMALQRDGTITKDGVFMIKPPGWKYRK